jgi:sulfur-carrier protein
MATIRIPPVLRPAVGGEREINAAGENVGEILQAVVAEHPGTETPTAT